MRNRYKFVEDEGTDQMPQGTIRAYNEQSRSGLILDDGKNELAFDQESFRESGLRELRIGQRVKFSLTGEPPRQKVRDLTIVSF
jgi:cold shock CspA family protein